MKTIKKIITIILSLTLILGLVACGETDSASDITKTYPNAHVIKLNTDSATLDGVALEEFDYTWHVDPSEVHDDVKNAPAEYYTGDEPETDAAAYIDHELYYYPSLDQSGFTLVNYDGENEWVYYYTDGVNNDYIFSTLPNLGSSFPSDMMHTEEEAAENKVLHITQAGEYILEGTWNGQIWVDLGDQDDTFADETAKVTIILNNADITCTVAPGVVFYSVYECDNTWEEQESWSADVDTSNAGANVIIADGSSNSVSGCNIFRMLKTKYKDEDSTDAVKVQKKVRKTDAAFYSYRTMNINGGDEGTGTLTITSNFEGLDSELHLSINGGNVTVNSQDDGINVNEDYVSVVSFNGGTVTLNASLGAEGDGVDSNGFVVINGGTLTVNGVVTPDSAVDSETGITYNGGTVVIDGETQELTAGSTMNSISSSSQGMGGDMNFNGQGGGAIVNPLENVDFDIAEFKEKVAELDDDATIQDVLELLGWGNMDITDVPTMPDGNSGNMDMNGQGGQMPNGDVPTMPDGNSGNMDMNGQGGQMPNGDVPTMPDGNSGNMDMNGQGGQMPNGDSGNMNGQGGQVPNGQNQ